MVAVSVGGWTVVQRDLVAVKFQFSKEATVCAYSPVKQVFSLTQECLGRLTGSLSELFMAKAVQKDIDDEPCVTITLDSINTRLNQHVLMIIDLAKHLPQEAKEKKSDGRESKKLTVKDVSFRHGLNVPEQVECWKKAQEIASAWFTQQSQNISGKKCWSVPIDQVLNNTWYLDPELHRFFMRHFKLQSSKEPFAFTSADRTAFGIQKGEKIADPSKVQCIAFAFLKARELHAKEYIFQGKELSEKDLPKLLKEWGYAPVETPVGNDLVMYVNSKGNATHLGRFLSSGKVESKLGINMPYFHWHNIFDVPSFYGNRVVFMHKS